MVKETKLYETLGVCHSAESIILHILILRHLLGCSHRNGAGTEESLQDWCFETSSWYVALRCPINYFKY